MFCGHSGHLDEFYFWHKRLERRRFEYARNSYRDDVFDFPPHSYSCASPHTSSRTFPQFSYGANHRSYSFGSRENLFEPRCLGYGPHPHRGDHFPRRPSFPTGGFHTHFELRHLDGPRFPRHGSRPTHSNGDVHKIVKTSFGHMVKCWIPKIVDMDSSCSRHMIGNNKWFSNLTPLSHKEYVTFDDDKKGKVLGTGVIKVNDFFTLNDVALMDRLGYKLLSVS
jgi:hypothetical protein